MSTLGAISWELNADPSKVVSALDQISTSMKNVDTNTDKTSKTVENLSSTATQHAAIQAQLAKSIQASTEQTLAYKIALYGMSGAALGSIAYFGKLAAESNTFAEAIGRMPPIIQKMTVSGIDMAASFASSFARLTSAVSDFVKTAAVALQPLISAIKGGLSSLVDIIQPIITVTRTAISSVLSIVSSQISGMLSAVATFAQGSAMLRPLVSSFQSVASVAGEVGKQLLDGAVKLGILAKEGIVSATVLERIAGALSSVSAGTRTAFTQLTAIGDSLHHLEIGALSFSKRMSSAMEAIFLFGAASYAIGSALEKMDNSFAQSMGHTLKWAATVTFALTAALAGITALVSTGMISVGEKLTGAVAHPLAMFRELQMAMVSFTIGVQDFNRFTKGATLSVAELMQYIVRLSSETGVSRTELKQGMAVLLESNKVWKLSAEQLKEIIAIAAKVSIVMGQDFQTTLIALEHAMSGNTMMAQNMGIALSHSSNAVGAHSRANQTNTDTTNKSVNATQMFNQLVIQTSGIVQGYLGVQETWIGKQNRLNAAIQDFNLKMGEGASKVWNPTTTAMNFALSTMEKLGDSIPKQIGFWTQLSGEVLTYGGYLLKVSVAYVTLYEGSFLISKAAQAAGWLTTNLAGLGVVGAVLTGALGSLHEAFLGLSVWLLRFATMSTLVIGGMYVFSVKAKEASDAGDTFGFMLYSSLGILMLFTGKLDILFKAFESIILQLPALPRMISNYLADILQFSGVFMNNLLAMFAKIGPAIMETATAIGKHLMTVAGYFLILYLMYEKVSFASDTWSEKVVSGMLVLASFGAMLLAITSVLKDMPKAIALVNEALAFMRIQMLTANQIGALMTITFMAIIAGSKAYKEYSEAVDKANQLDKERSVRMTKWQTDIEQFGLVIADFKRTGDITETLNKFNMHSPEGIAAFKNALADLGDAAVNLDVKGKDTPEYLKKLRAEMGSNVEVMRTITSASKQLRFIDPEYLKLANTEYDKIFKSIQSGIDGIAAIGKDVGDALIFFDITKITKAAEGTDALTHSLDSASRRFIDVLQGIDTASTVIYNRVTMLGVGSTDTLSKGLSEAHTREIQQIETRMAYITEERDLKLRAFNQVREVSETSAAANRAHFTDMGSKLENIAHEAYGVVTAYRGITNGIKGTTVAIIMQDAELAKVEDRAGKAMAAIKDLTNTALTGTKEDSRAMREYLIAIEELKSKPKELEEVWLPYFQSLKKGMIDELAVFKKSLDEKMALEKDYAAKAREFKNQLLIQTQDQADKEYAIIHSGVGGLYSAYDAYYHYKQKADDMLALAKKAHLENDDGLAQQFLQRSITYQDKLAANVTDANNKILIGEYTTRADRLKLNTEYYTILRGITKDGEAKTAELRATTLADVRNVASSIATVEAKLINLGNIAKVAITASTGAHIDGWKKALDILDANYAGVVSAPKTLKITADETQVHDAIQSAANKRPYDITVNASSGVGGMGTKMHGGLIAAMAEGGFSLDYWHRRAGGIPGYGGGDKVPTLLEAGEFILRKEAVSKYGLEFLQRLNSGANISETTVAPRPNQNNPAMSTGGTSETIRIEFGGRAFDMGPRDQVRQFAEALQMAGRGL